MTIHATLQGEGVKGKGKGEVLHFSDLEAWQMSRSLCKLIYTWTKNFPKDEQFGLTSQLRRASVSIAANIAEGFGRFHAKEKKQFYTTAKSSCIEVEAELIVSFDQELITKTQLLQGKELCEKIQKATSGLITSMRSRII